MPPTLHPVRSLVLLSMLTASVLAPLPAGAQYAVIHEDGFEGYPLGSYPAAPWANFYPGISGAVTNAQAFEGARSFRLEGSATELRVDILPLEPIPDLLYFRAAVRPGTNGRGFGLGSGFESPLDPGVGLPANLVAFNGDQSITFNCQTAAEVDLGVWDAGRWYDVILEIDYRNQRADIVIDGSARGFQLPCDPPILPATLFGVEIPLDRLVFATFDFEDGGSNVLHVDDVLVMGRTVAAPEAAPPTAWSLSAPHPNPARGEARLELALPADAVVDVGVFDIAGRRTATLASGALPAGVHPLRWQADPALPAGVFLVRARVGAEESTRRLVRVR